MNSVRPVWSLRSRLLLGVLLPVAVLFALNTWTQYRQALKAADTAYDRTLLASAKVIGEQLDVMPGPALKSVVPYSALEAFEADNRSRMVFKVTGFQGEMVSGFQDLKTWHGRLLFADDSSVARGQIERTLAVLGLKHISAVNGRAAWDELLRIATVAEASGRHVKDYVQLVLTDVEMPEMDGYLLTKNIKADPRFAGIPVIMHSSLSSMSNQQLGRSVGVDEYVPKFEPHRLAETLGRLLLNRVPAHNAAH